MMYANLSFRVGKVFDHNTKPRDKWLNALVVALLLLLFKILNTRYNQLRDWSINIKSILSNKN